MAARHRRHSVKAPKPTWLVVEAAPPAPGKAPAPPAAYYYSPLLLSPSPSAWQQKARHTGIKKGRAGHGHPGGVPDSPRIGCMGQVNGGTRCSSSSARGGRSGSSSEHGGGLAGLLMGLFRRRRTRGIRKPRACCKVRDVPSDSSSSSGSIRGSRAPAAACAIDPPLPVPVLAVRRAAREDNGPSLWERRRGVGKALEGLQLT